MLERRRDAVQGLADHAVRRGWLDPWDVKAVFQDRAMRRQQLRHPEAILSDLEWTESELLDRALAVRRDGRRLDRTTTEDAVAIPMQVPSEYVSALEGLRPDRPDRYFDLAEITLSLRAPFTCPLAVWYRGSIGSRRIRGINRTPVRRNVRISARH